ncbi:MAG: rRNA maturation RNase YbeY [Proteobacteria bacterium]|nr:rRNA maturation RNase YbeY [Pseudomonadota bacterium]
MSAEVDVQLACNDDDVPQPDTIAAWVSNSVEAAGRSGSLEVSVRIVGVDEIRALNRDFRSKDEPTNVLSFPAGSVAGLPDGLPVALGDVVVCAPVVRREAGEQGKTVRAHWAHVLVHGTLHLLGYDHVDEREAVEMEALETRILAAWGIPDPYGAPGHN